MIFLSRVINALTPFDNDYLDILTFNLSIIHETKPFMLL